MNLIIQWMNTSAERNMMAAGRLNVLKLLYRPPYIHSRKNFCLIRQIHCIMPATCFIHRMLI